jgi:hypothetical protein
MVFLPAVRENSNNPIADAKNLHAAAPVIRKFPGVLVGEHSFVLSPPEEEKRPQEKNDSEGQKDHIPQHFI